MSIFPFTFEEAEQFGMGCQISYNIIGLAAGMRICFTYFDGRSSVKPQAAINTSCTRRLGSGAFFGRSLDSIKQLHIQTSFNRMKLERYYSRTIELDPDILSTPFKIDTNWHVLTGAACTGKTTLIDMLAKKGYQIVPESARLFFAQEMAKGRVLEEIRKAAGSLQRGIASMQWILESKCQTNRITFLDRALPDSLAFYRRS